MTQSRKIEDYKELMATRGVPRSTSWPPLWQVCSAFGLELPPPLFMGPLSLFFITGTTFGLLFGFGAWVLGNRGMRSMPLSKAGWVALITGTAFGMAMSWYYRRQARKQQLGLWCAFDTARLRT